MNADDAKLGTDAQLQSEEKHSQMDEKKEAMEKANQSNQPDAKKFQRKGERSVLDPVTGRHVVIKDAELKGQSVPP